MTILHVKFDDVSEVIQSGKEAYSLTPTLQSTSSLGYTRVDTRSLGSTLIGSLGEGSVMCTPSLLSSVGCGFQ